MTEHVGSDLAQTSERNDLPDWWRTVTPGELRASSDVVRNFLGGSGAATSIAVEAFARALALHQLFADGTAVRSAAELAHDLMPSIPKLQPKGAMVRAAEAWLERGAAIAVGLTRCIELLRPQERREEWRASLERFEISLGLLQSECVAAAAHVGPWSGTTASVPVKLRPDKV